MMKRNIRSSTLKNKEGSNYDIKASRIKKHEAALNDIRKNLNSSTTQENDIDSTQELEYQIDEKLPSEWTFESKAMNLEEAVIMEEDLTESLSQEEFDKNQYFKGISSGKGEMIHSINICDSVIIKAKRPLRSMPLHVYKNEILRRKMRIQKENL